MQGMLPDKLKKVEKNLKKKVEKKLRKKLGKQVEKKLGKKVETLPEAQRTQGIEFKT